MEKLMIRNVVLGSVLGLLLGVGLFIVFPAHARPMPADGPHLTPLAGSACPGGVAHCFGITWVDSTSQAGCTGTCSFGYNILVGTSPGGESATPVNATLLSGPPYTFTGVVLGANPVTYYVEVQAVETSGGVPVAAAPSNEVSQSFPGVPAPATGAAVQNPE